VRVDAPPTVDAAFHEAADGTVHVVLANRTGHDLYATGRPAMWETGPNGSTARMSWSRAVVPVAGIAITGEGTTSAGSLRGRGLRATGAEGTFELDRLDDLDLITVR
jgi:hypothetical protein